MEHLVSCACFRAHHTCASSTRNTSAVVHNLLLRQWCYACHRVRDACVSGVRSTSDSCGEYVALAPVSARAGLAVVYEYHRRHWLGLHGYLLRHDLRAVLPRPSSEYSSSSLAASRCHGTQRHAIMTNRDLRFAQPHHSERIQLYVLLCGSVTGALSVKEDSRCTHDVTVSVGGHACAR